MKIYLIFVLLSSLPLFAEDECESNQCITKRNVNPRASQEEQLIEVKKTCDCINSDTTFMTQINKKFAEQNLADEMRAKHYRQFKAYLKHLDNELSVDALIFDSYAPFSANKNIISLFQRDVKYNKVTKDQFNKAEKILGLKEDEKKSLHEIVSNTEKATPEERLDKLLAKPEPSSCINYFDYLKFKKSKIDPVLTEYLSQKPKNDDWDYNSLLKKLDDSKDNSDEEKVIKAKLNYLNKNPIVRSFFMDHKTKNPKNMEKFNKVRQDVLGHMAENFKKGDSETLNKKLLSYFSSSDEVDDDKRQRRAWRHIEVNDQFNQDRFGRLLSAATEKGTFQNYSDFKSYQQDFFQMNFDRCDFSLGRDFDIQYCKAAFVAYCNSLKDLDKPKKLKKSLSFELGLVNKDINNPDTDLEFKELTRKVCYPQGMKEVDGSFQLMSFYEYKNSCQTNQKIDPVVCLDDQKLLRSYLNEYKLPSVSSTSDEELFQKFILKLPEPTGLTQAQKVALIESSKKNMSSFRSADLGRMSHDLDYGFATSDKKDETLTPLMKEEALKASSETQEEFKSENSLEDFQSTKVADMGNMSSNFTFYNQTLNEKKVVDQEVEKIKEEIKTVTETKDQEDEVKEKKKLEDRLKQLETLLAEKELLSQKYESTLENLVSRNEKQLKNPSKKLDSAPLNFNTDEPNFSQQASVEASASNQPVISSNSSSARANFSTEPASNQAYRSPAAVRSSFDSQTKLNAALLQANERKSGSVQMSSDGSITLGSLNETQNNTLLSEQVKSGNIDIIVSGADYDGFELNKLDAFSKYRKEIENKLKDNQPTKIIVRNGKHEPLEFLAYKEKGKLFFKPLRKTGASLEALRSVVKEQR